MQLKVQGVQKNRPKDGQITKPLTSASPDTAQDVPSDTSPNTPPSDTAQIHPPSDTAQNLPTSDDTTRILPPSDPPAADPETKPPDQNSPSQELTHLTSTGTVRMVDISHKTSSTRSASASCILLFSSSSTSLILERAESKKGDPLAVARIAGIQAVKKTADLIPLAHPSLAITSVNIDITPLPGTPMLSKHSPQPKNPSRSPGAGGGVLITSHVTSEGKTGIEMEALTSVTVAALTVYDMCKGVDRHMELRSAKVVAKAGGKSGDWTLDEPTVRAAFGSGLTPKQASLVAYTARKQARIDGRVWGEVVGRELYSMASGYETEGGNGDLESAENERGAGIQEGGNGASKGSSQPPDGRKWSGELWHEWSRQYR